VLSFKSNGIQKDPSPALLRRAPSPQGSGEEIKTTDLVTPGRRGRLAIRNPSKLAPPEKDRISAGKTPAAAVAAVA